MERGLARRLRAAVMINIGYNKLCVSATRAIIVSSELTWVDLQPACLRGSFTLFFSRAKQATDHMKDLLHVDILLG